MQQKLADIAAMSAANQQAARTAQAKALADGNYWLAMHIARLKLPQRDLYKTVVRALDAGQEKVVASRISRSQDSISAAVQLLQLICWALWRTRKNLRWQSR
ncbi:hypothetical protein [Paraglaciecola hydrolytica]|uniref:Uncharacterized protein n=1 Tax=Paraglaciecola hydrolytica TaxID=1799789 RepID=A0A148KLM1_9ALTE|nr:hypothetical protein [Paraglaciecola hydrolytica]KXI27148.1 hypothetical protein AX660_01815 [Paraglaciecola hydrolytica]